MVVPLAGGSLKHRVVGIGVTLAALIAVSIVGSNSVPAHAANTIHVNRLAGSDRYGTAVAVAQDAYASRDYLPNVAPVVFVASGTNFPDALSAAPAAATLGGPLLLTNPNTLPRGVATEITSLGPAKIVVVGGTGAVSAAVFNQLKALIPTAVVARIAGIDRFATSRAINAAAFAKASAVFVTTSRAIRFRSIGGRREAVDYQGTRVPSQDQRAPVGPSSGRNARRRTPVAASAGSPPTDMPATRLVRRKPGARAFTLISSPRA